MAGASLCTILTGFQVLQTKLHSFIVVTWGSGQGIPRKGNMRENNKNYNDNNKNNEGFFQFFNYRRRAKKRRSSGF